VAAEVSGGLAAQFGRRAPGVEDVQEAIEQALWARGLSEVARAFAACRRQRAELRHAKQPLGVRDELKLSLRPPEVGEPQAAWPAVSFAPLLCEIC
jgi:ribonucleoside-diphosphate reductase alpha chain